MTWATDAQYYFEQKRQVLLATTQQQNYNSKIPTFNLQFMRRHLSIPLCPIDRCVHCAIHPMGWQMLSWMRRAGAGCGAQRCLHHGAFRYQPTSTSAEVNAKLEMGRTTLRPRAGLTI